VCRRRRVSDRFLWWLSAVLNQGVRDVFADRSTEQRRLLRNDADRTAKVDERKIPDVVSVE